MQIKYHLIFGCGYYGRLILRKFKFKNIFFLDNNQKIKKCLGKKVLRPNDLIKKNILIKRIYLAGRYIDEQLVQLKNLKINADIRIFQNKELKQTKNKLIIREKKILGILKILIKELNDKKIRYWLDRSSLLAIKRDQLLSELSDVDISVDINDYEKFQSIMKKLFKKRNIYIYKKKILLNKKKYCKYYLSSSNKDINKNEPALIDFIYRKVKKNFVYSCGINLKRVPLNMIYPYKIINYKSILIYIPTNSKKYLNYIYGKNWKIRAKFYLRSSRI